MAVLPPRPPMHPEDKKPLRARMRAGRDLFVWEHPGVQLAGGDWFAERLTPGTLVASYQPIGGEADPAPLVAAAVAKGCALALPHVTSRAEPIRFLRWDPSLPLKSGPFGLRQPAADLTQVAPEVILTPLVAFDRQLNRLGQGAGHYDRAFAAHPAAWRVGVAWSMQQVEALAADPWDVPLHAIVTELGVIER